MRLIGREKLCCLNNAGEQVKKWVLSWVAEVTSANWKQPDDVGAQFPNARQVKDGHFLFPVGGCSSAISLLIAFPQGIALIAALEVKDTQHGN